MSKLLIKSGDDWTLSLLEKLDDLGAHYMKELGFTHYPLQIEVVSPRQMLGLYASHAMPIMYDHWSFGEQYLDDYREFATGKKGLAYEICKNTNPCLCYNMETNNAIEHASVIFHVYGHSSHFASNYLYKHNSDADKLIPYMEYARSFIKQCESKYGVTKVEHVIDLAHSLEYSSVNHYKRYKVDNKQKQLERELFLINNNPDSLRDKLSDTRNARPIIIDPNNTVGKSVNLPEENLLYFIEHHSPVITNWQREICAIVRNLAQFSYQNFTGQSQIMAEGTAMFTECYIMERAHADGYIDQGSYIEYLRMNSMVLYQNMVNNKTRDPYDAIQNHRLNPYFLGLEMMRDIRRMCEHPNESDRKFNPEICGSDWKKTLSDAITYYKDESFILQYLSPHLIKKLRMMHTEYDTDEPDELLVKSHAEHYDDLRNSLAEINTLSNNLPNVKVTEYDPGSLLTLTYYPVHDRQLYQPYVHKVIDNIEELMGCVVVFDAPEEEEEEA